MTVERHCQSRAQISSVLSEILVHKSHHPNLLSNHNVSCAHEKLSFCLQSEPFHFETVGAKISINSTTSATINVNQSKLSSIQYDQDVVASQEKFIDRVTIPIQIGRNSTATTFHLLITLIQSKSCKDKDVNSEQATTTTALRLQLFQDKKSQPCSTLEIPLPSSSGTTFNVNDFSCTVLSDPTVPHCSTKKLFVAICPRRKSDRIHIVQVEEDHRLRTSGHIEPEETEKLGVSSCSALFQSEMCVVWNSGHIAFYRLYGSDIHGNVLIDCLSMNRCWFITRQEKIISLEPLWHSKLSKQGSPKWIMVRHSNSVNRLVTNRSIFGASSTITTSDTSLQPSTGALSIQGLTSLSSVHSKGTIFEPGTLMLSELQAMHQQENESGCFVSIIGRTHSNSIFQSNEVRCSFVDPDFAVIMMMDDNDKQQQGSVHFSVTVANHFASHFCTMSLQYSIEHGSLQIQSDSEMEEGTGQETITIESIATEQQKILGICHYCPSPNLTNGSSETASTAHGPKQPQSHYLVVLSGSKSTEHQKNAFFFASPVHLGQKYSNLMLHLFKVREPSKEQGEEEEASVTHHNFGSLYSLISDLRQTMTLRFDQIDHAVSNLSDRVLRIENHLSNTNQ